MVRTGSMSGGMQDWNYLSTNDFEILWIWAAPSTSSIRSSAQNGRGTRSLCSCSWKVTIWGFRGLCLIQMVSNVTTVVKGIYHDLMTDNEVD